MTDEFPAGAPPSYVGAKTFMNAAEAEPDELPADVDVGVVGVPFDGAASRQPGARYGPEALRRESGWWSDRRGGERFNAATGRTVDFDALALRDCGDVPVVTTDPERTGRNVREAVRAVAESAFPVVLGGDHYLTYPSFAGFAAAREERVGLVHLDSHSDTYGAWEGHGEHWHGSPMNLIADSDFGGYDTHAMVGLRAYESPDFPEFVERTGLHVSYARDVHERGILACLADALAHATDGADVVYLTVDVDVVDPVDAPGTGTPEFEGPSASQLLRAMDWLGEQPAVGGMDLVEVAPRLDPSRTTQRLGAAAISRFLEARFMS